MPDPTAQPELPIAARRHPLVAEVRRQMGVRCGWDGTSPLAVGVSGGADSLALLIACDVIRQGPGGALTAVYVHHHLRAEADADVEHVRAVCQRLGVPLLVEHVHPAGEAGNLAATARRLRYEALQQAAERTGAAIVAVGHHVEDQLETLMMALCRGAGLEGLSGMAWRRPLVGDVWLIRPLLASRKAECQSLCAAAGIEWREDASNADLTRTRARLRSDVLPVLEELWPGSAERATATADIIAAAGELVSARLNEVFGDAAQRTWSRDALRSLPLPLIAAGIRRAAIDALGGSSDELSQRGLMPIAEAVADDVRRPRVFGLPRALRVRVRAGKVEMESGGTQASVH